MPKLNVVQFVASAEGGMAQHVGQVCEVLSGHHHVIAIAGPQVHIPAGVTHIPMTARARPGMSWFLAMNKLRAVAGNADIVHAHGLRAGFMAALALRARRLKHVPLIITLHSLPPTRGVAGKASDLQWAIARRRTSAVLAVSRAIAQWAGVRFDQGHESEKQSRIFAQRALIPVAPPQAQQNYDDPSKKLDLAKFGLDETWPLVLTVARLAPQKGIEFLLQAARRLRLTSPQVQWVVVGEGPLESLAAQAPDNVYFVGRSDIVAQWMRAADMVVNTSSSEGQPVVVQEALHLGCVIIATDVGGTSEVTQDAALLVPYGDESALVHAIEQVLHEETVGPKLQEQAIRRAKTLPTEVDLQQQLSSMYQRVIE